MTSLAVLTASATHWNDFANSKVGFAEYEESRGSSGAPARNLAATCRRTVVALYLESTDGVPRCSCCLKTAAEHAASKPR